MVVETAADRAAFFATADFGQAATFRPKFGNPVAVTIVLDTAVAVAPLPGALGVTGPKRIALLRKDEVAAPAKGDRITVGADTYDIRSGPELDISGEIWRLDLSILP